MCYKGPDVGVCGLTWWRKLENPRKTANPGRANTSHYAYIRVRTLVAAAIIQASVLLLRYPGSSTCNMTLRGCYTVPYDQCG